MTEDKTVEWLGDSREIIKYFPDDIKMDLGADLYRLQKGLEPNNWKPFPGLKRNASFHENEPLDFTKFEPVPSADRRDAGL